MDYQAIIVSVGKLAVFAVFITAIIEVIKNVAAKGLLNMVKELLFSLVKSSPLSVDSMKMLNFIIALVYCRVFDYGVMQEILQLQFGEYPLAYLLDYIGTASVIYMGADWVFAKFMDIKGKYGNGKPPAAPTSPATGQVS